MLSERQMTPTSRAQINQANAQHSTGPKTEAGKHRSSLNALRHGLTGQIIVLPSDDLEAYQRHIKSFVKEYQPKGATEQNLVQTLADNVWRQHRVAALENNVLTLGIVGEQDVADDVQQALAIAASLESQTKALANLSLHGQRLSRQFEKTLALLQELQLKREIEEEVSMGQASALIHMHALKEEPYDPSEDGFVFPDGELEAYMHKNGVTQRAYEAEEYCEAAAS